MRIKINIYCVISLLLVLSFLLSCVREEVVPYGNNGKSKLVVVGFISPGERINIYVGKSQPFGKNDYQLSDFMEASAMVTISNLHGQQQRLFLNSSGSSIYSCSQLDFPIMAGETYRLHVQSSIGEVIAETLVPKNAAIWKEAKLSGPQAYNYYTFSGSWQANNLGQDVDYGVNIMVPTVNISDRMNEGIAIVNDNYSVKREIFMAQANTINAVLLTRDKAFGAFSRKSDLTLEVIENLNSAGFTDIISGFKGLIPNAGNINGGLGVFGSYLKNVRAIRK